MNEKGNYCGSYRYTILFRYTTGHKGKPQAEHN